MVNANTGFGTASHRSWLPCELMILEVFSHEKLSTVAQMLAPRRSLRAIKSKRQLLINEGRIQKRRPRTEWRMSEIKYLQENYKLLPARVIAKKLGRTRQAIYAQAQALKNEHVDGVGHSNWEPWELKILEDYDDIPTIVEKLAPRRTIAAIRLKRQRLINDNQLDKSLYNEPWKTNELKYIEENYGLLPVREIARVLDRSRGSVYAQIQLLKKSGRIQ